MPKYKVFVDGAVGTTGLKIHQRLSLRSDIEVLVLPDAHRKDVDARRDKIQEADLSFLCLPDEAAREIVVKLPESVKICDTSTAHRTHAGWVYGFPELSGQTSLIQHSNRVSIPGCHATGFIALIRPLIENGILAADYPLSCHSLTGYSGGGKTMIADYQRPQRPDAFGSPRMYGLQLSHKHLSEMKQLSGTAITPIFTPIVADYYCGMLVTVPLPISALTEVISGEQLHALFSDYYQHSKVIQVKPLNHQSQAMLAANTLAEHDGLTITLFANKQQLLLTALFDNLGKGSSGAAVQCMNIMLGLEETKGLQLSFI